MRKDACSNISKIPVAKVDGPLESAASFTRGGTPAGPDHDAPECQRATRIKAEQSRLICWAKDNAKLGERLPREDTSGGEHRISFDPKSKRCFKSTIPEKHKGYGIALGSFTHGATPAEYLDRLSLQNGIFNDDIRLECVVLKDNTPIIVTTQPFITGTYPQQDALDEMMTEHGFEKFTSGGYYDCDEGLLVFDLFPKNAKVNEAGVICPFDPVVQRITADFADFLRDNPDRIHNR